MNARNEAECYTRYRATARRFELFGAAILAAGVLCYTAFGDSVKWPGVALGAVGLCAFALGAASLRPHNVVKSFALQCMQNPNEEYARGLLNALTAERRIRLTMRSIRMVRAQNPPHNALHPHGRRRRHNLRPHRKRRQRTGRTPSRRPARARGEEDVLSI